MANKTTCRHCFENGHAPQSHCQERKAYDAQVTWNRRMRVLLSHEPDLSVPEPPDYSDHWATGPIGAALRYQNGAGTWTRAVYSLLAQDGVTYRRLRTALDKAARSEKALSLEPDAAPVRQKLTRRAA
jgi:hypothetical protein